jgi:hypothetical protein
MKTYEISQMFPRAYNWDFVTARAAAKMIAWEDEAEKSGSRTVHLGGSNDCSVPAAAPKDKNRKGEKSP